MDALGTGLFLPFSILFFTATTSMSLAEVGLGVAVASGLRLPLGPALGSLVDRWDAYRTLVLANVVQMAGFVGYLTGAELLDGPVTASLSAEAAPEHLRGRYLPVYQLSGNVSGTVGTALLTWLLSLGSAPVWAALAIIAVGQGPVVAALSGTAPEPLA